MDYNCSWKLNSKFNWDSSRSKENIIKKMICNIRSKINHRYYDPIIINGVDRHWLTNDMYNKGTYY